MSVFVQIIYILLAIAFVQSDEPVRLGFDPGTVPVGPFKLFLVTCLYAVISEICRLRAKCLVLEAETEVVRDGASAGSVSRIRYLIRNAGRHLRYAPFYGIVWTTIQPDFIREFSETADRVRGTDMMRRYLFPLFTNEKEASS